MCVCVCVGSEGEVSECLSLPLIQRKRKMKGKSAAPAPQREEEDTPPLLAAPAQGKLPSALRKRSKRTLRVVIASEATSSHTAPQVRE